MPTLILLAGGKSTRFGRPKQLEPVGPAGEALLDLSLRDAFATGCDRAVIVVRPEHEVVFADRFAGEPRVRFVVQADPCGTAHAVMLGLEQVQDTVIIANGDDHYGKGSVQQAMDHALHVAHDLHALVAFELYKTLSPSGGVNRAMCIIAADGTLRSTEEVRGLRADPEGRITSEDGRTWPGEALVSMNLWVLRPTLFPLFRALFGHHQPAKGEFGLPTVVASAMEQRHRFRVLRTAESWCGLTHPADAELVRRHINPHA